MSKRITARCFCWKVKFCHTVQRFILQNTGHTFKWDLQPTYDIFSSATNMHWNTKKTFPGLCSVMYVL